MNYLDVVYMLVLLGLSGFGFHRLMLLLMSLNRAQKNDHRSNESLNEKGALLPKVTVQLPIYNERHVATRLIEAACLLDYDRDRMEIQVLDDSTDDTRILIDESVAHWRSHGYPIEVIRRHERIGFKAGALSEGMQQASGELIAVFDADFIPQKSFLRSLIPHLQAPNIGMVQARWAHLNRHESLLTEAQAVLLDGHFSIEQRARNLNGLWFNFNGTAGIWKRACIEEAGGWAHETLTEDLDLSYRAQMKGWSFKYVDEVGVPSELPTGLDAFRSQQHRWAKGSIQVAKKLLPRILRGQYSIRIKFEAMCHLLANLNYLLVSALCVAVPLIVLYEPGTGLLSWIGGQLFLVGSCCFGLFYLGSQREQQPLMRTCALLPFVFALGLSLCLNNSKAVIEALLGQISPFVRTPKSGSLGQKLSLNTRYLVDSNRTLNLIESLMLIVYAGALGVSIHHGIWQHVPLLSLFIAGFSVRFWGSMRVTFGPFLKVRSFR